MIRRLVCWFKFGHDWQWLSERHKGRPTRRCQCCGLHQWRVWDDVAGGMWWTK